MYICIYYIYVYIISFTYYFTSTLSLINSSVITVEVTAHETLHIILSPSSISIFLWSQFYTAGLSDSHVQYAPLPLPHFLCVIARTINCPSVVKIN